MRWILSGASLVAGMLLVACSSQPDEQPPPDRYRSFCSDQTPPDSQYFLTGVGVGPDVASARQIALADIAQKLSSNVQVTTRSSLRAVDDYESESFDQDVLISSDVAIDTAVELCRDVHDPDGKVYLVYQLDKRPLIQRVYSDLLESWRGVYPEAVEFKGPSILRDSRFIADLRSKLERAGEGGTSKTVVVDLRRQNNQWVLIINEGAVYTVADRHFLTLISPDFRGTVKALDIDVVSDAGGQPPVPEDFRFARSVRLRHGESFNFRIASRRSGYVSIFNVYEDGRIANLLENRFVTNNQAVVFPEGGAFTSLLLEDGKSTYDVYIGVLTDTPIMLSEFAKLEAHKGFLTGDQFYQFDQFLRWFDFVDPTGVATLEARTDP